MPSKKYRTPILQERIYHIFNRGINHQVVFHSNSDKEWFLRRFKHYLKEYAEVHSYCILDNHYHFLIKIKQHKGLPSHFSRQFGNLILSYTHYYNRKYDHSGPVFHRCFKRLKVEEEVYFLMLYWYIHNNPEKHRLVDDYRSYVYSSYQGLLTGNDLLVTQVIAMESFGGLIPFREFHERRHKENQLDMLTME